MRAAVATCVDAQPVLQFAQRVRDSMAFPVENGIMRAGTFMSEREGI